jgi:vancomycin resistance protein YoaR
MPSLPPIAWQAALGSTALLLVAGTGWKIAQPDPVAVPPRSPLPAVLRLTDGKHVWKLQAEKIGLDPDQRRLDLGKAASTLKTLANQANTPGKDARLVFSSAGFSPTQSEMKREVNLNTSLHRLVDYTNSAYPSSLIRLAVNKKPPRVTTEDLEKIEGPVAGFTTRYNPGDRPRTRNVQLVTERLNGAIVPEGGVFSFNDWVGPRDESAGFKTAHIFVGGKMVAGTGGGTCQVSSTLYNATLLAGLQIVERSNHSLTVPYVTPGRDATVYYGQRDFKFKNTTAAPIYIRASAYRGHMEVTLYGLPRHGPKIEVVSWAHRKGSRIYAGATRLYKEGGRVVKREPLSSDVYTPLELAVHQG